MSANDSTRPICELGDAVITLNEVKILKSKDSWLNDSIITFYFEWCKYNSTLSDSIVLIHPGSAFMLRMLPPEELTASIPPGGNPFVDATSQRVRVICLPINNANDSEVGGGSHWSLLIFYKDTHRAVHLDSSSGMNRVVARETCACLGNLLFIEKYEFVEAKDAYQQSNSYDCGIISLMHVHDLMFPDDKRFFYNSSGTIAVRNHLLELIDTCQKIT